MTSLGFDVGNTKPQAAFDPLPPGWYAMRIAKSDVGIGKNSESGQMLKLEFEIMDSQHPELTGRRAFTTLCHQHPSKQTRDIARSQIAAIAQAIGRPTASMSDDFLGGELRVKLSVKAADGTYEARNECKGYKGLAEPVDATPPAAGGPPAGGAPATAPKQQPWKR